MITGTYHFFNKESAIKYYGSRSEVDEALKEGRIAIGEPQGLKPDQRIILIDDGLRYGIEDNQQWREGDTLRGVKGLARIEFSQLGFHGRIQYTPKPWKSFYKGDAGLHFATIEEANTYFKRKGDYFSAEDIANLVDKRLSRETIYN
jgi:hypothetical protein